jgi:outer membrane protein OmpA-like peptidoglycan-associated protein
MAPALLLALTGCGLPANVDLSVVGHVDRKDAYNSALSLERAQIVRDALVAAGIPSEVIEIAYHGANNPLVPTPRGVPELRNRRVEVTIR